jgi:hypothetical protein
MPNGRSFNRESMATEERGSLETCCVESFLVVYLLCVLAISDRRQRTVPSAHKGLMTNWPHHGGRLDDMLNLREDRKDIRKAGRL